MMSDDSDFNACPLCMLNDSLSVQLHDEINNPVVDYPVTFEIIEGSGLIDDCVTLMVKQTNHAGVASISFRTGIYHQYTRISASAFDENGDHVEGSPVVIRISITPPLTLIYRDGDNQQGVLGTWLQAPLIVKCIDFANNPIPNQQILYCLTKGSASLNQEPNDQNSAQELFINTDIDGLAKCYVKIGKTIGDIFIQAHLRVQEYEMPGSPVIFTILAQDPTSINAQRQSLAAQVEYKMQNYPNPFNDCTTIVFSLPTSGMTTLTIYAISGSEIEVLKSDVFHAGHHKVTWDASAIASGVYLYRLETEDFFQTKKMILVR